MIGQPSAIDDSPPAAREPQVAIPDAPSAEPEPGPVTIRTPVDVRSAALAVLAVIAIVLTLQYAQAMVIPIVLGVLLSYALAPVVGGMEHWRIPRALAAAVVLIALVSSCGWLVFSLRSEANAIVEQLPEAARRVRRLVENDRPTTTSAIQQVQKAATELQKATTATTRQPPPPSGVQRVQVETTPFNISDYVLWGSIGIAAAVGRLVLILFLAYFLLASGDLYRRKLLKIVGPSLTKKKITLQILSEIDRQIEMFLIVEAFTSTIVALATWLAFRALGVEQAAVWGILAGVFNSIPYFGPVLVTGGPRSSRSCSSGTFTWPSSSRGSRSRSRASRAFSSRHGCQAARRA